MTLQPERVSISKINDDMSSTLLLHDEKERSISMIVKEATPKGIRN